MTLLAVWSASVASAQAPATADAAWARIEALKPKRSLGVAHSAAPDWAALAREAAAFQRDFPNDPKAPTAAKLELVALIHADDDQPQLSTDTVSRVQAYLADKGNAVRDRLEVEIASAQGGFRHTSFLSRGERLQAQAAHAAELIAEFPDEPEGYGYQLALAKAESPDNARRLATALLAASAAPAAFKAGAERVVARLDLVGKPLVLSGAEKAIADAQGHPLAVYTWSARDRGFVELVNRLARDGDVRFIGVNLDADRSAAQARAVSYGAPGPQFYDGGGLDGPLARQLQLTISSSLYLVDAQGVVRFVDGQDNAQTKLARLVSEKGAQQ